MSTKPTLSPPPGARQRPANGEPAAAPPARRFDPATIREFQFPDGRPITLHKHCVWFATPLVTDPERQTLVGIKNSKPCPLNVTYTNFMAWWLKP